jgi:hypothetical protein
VDNRLLFLASSGIRTAIDQLIVAKIGDVGNFKTKLDTLESKSIIDPDEKEFLGAVIDAGSASAHRSFCPEVETIYQMLDILESIFFKILIAPKRRDALKNKAKAIRGETPKRKQT